MINAGITSTKSTEKLKSTTLANDMLSLINGEEKKIDNEESNSESRDIRPSPIKLLLIRTP